MTNLSDVRLVPRLMCVVYVVADPGPPLAAASLQTTENTQSTCVRYRLTQKSDIIITFRNT